jgi:hypothetical protein
LRAALEKKDLMNLLRFEADHLGETFYFIYNSRFWLFDKAMDVLAGL